jgi:hypothetical protein
LRACDWESKAAERTSIYNPADRVTTLTAHH